MSLTKHEIELSDGSRSVSEHRSSPWSIIMGAGAAGTMMLMALAYTGVFTGGPTEVIIDGEGTGISINTIENTLQPTFLFASDWGYALGDSSGATSNNGIMGNEQGTAGADSLLTVILKSGIGWPSELDNVVRVGAQGNTINRMINTPSDSSWRAPAEGDTTWYRIYFRYNNNSATDNANTQHWWQPESSLVGAPTTTHNYNFRFARTATDPDSTFQLFFNNRFRVAETSNDQWGVVLTVGTVYRFEWQIPIDSVNLGDTLYSDPTFRVYDANLNTIVADNDDFDSVQNPGTFLSSHAGDEAVIYTDDVRKLLTAEIGNNGPASNFDIVLENYFEFSAFAVCETTWCGEYTLGEGP